MRLALFAGLVALAPLAGCDNTIETPDSLRGTYTLWGALDPTTDIQAVRVVAVADTLQVRSAAALPITVASVDLATGAETAWRDSVVTFRDGSVGHVYYAAFRPAYESRYRVVLRRDAGGEVSATATVPPLVVPAVQPTDFSLGGTRAPVFWAGASQLGRIRVTYYVQKYNVLVAGAYEYDRPLCELDTLSLGLVASPGRVAGGWITAIDLARAQRILDDRFREAPPEEYNVPLGGPTTRRFEIGLDKITLSAEVLSEEWRPPGDVFDFEVLAAPEAFGNVEGGFGFVGAGYRSELTFLPVSQDLTRAGFFSVGSLCPPVP